MLPYFRKHLPDRNLWVIYRTMLVLSTAYGVALAVLPILLESRQMPHETVGELASWFAVGLVVGAAPSGWIIRKVSARATFAASILGYGAMIALLPFCHSYEALAVNRFVDGLFSMGAWVSAETLILWRSTRQNKALATSLSATFTMFGYLLGPVLSLMLSRLASWSFEPRLFLAGAIAAVASVMAATGLAADPDPEHRRRAHGQPGEGEGTVLLRPYPALAWRIRASCAATFCSGFFQSSAALFIPRFLMQEKNVPGELAGLVVAFAAAGMLMMANFAARAGDRFGHLLVMRTLAVIGVVGVLGFLPLTSFPVMAAVFVVAGGAISSIPPLSLALQGVISTPAEYPRSNAIFNVFFATGLV
ncbi:MAG: MFS transporter, partial [Verrucomicrobiales bacterium]|nr:MFS transporter [Verrucomicrobiales bacterium]